MLRRTLIPPPGHRPDEAAARRLKRIEMLLAGILILMALAAVYFAKVVVMPIVLAFLITLTLSPLVRGLRRIGVPEPVSAIGIIVVLALSVAAAVYFASGPVTRFAERAPEIGRELQQKLGGLLEQVEKVQKVSEEVTKVGQDQTPSETEPERVVIEEPGWMEVLAGSLAGAGTAGSIALVLALFMMSSGRLFQRKLVEVFPRLQDKKRALKISFDIEKQISRYLAAITTINAGLGLCIGAGLWLIGMPYAPLWGLAAFFLNFLPYLGALVGTGAVAAFALVSFDTVGQALAAPAIYLTLTTLEGQIVTPTLVGRHLSLNTVAVFIAVVFWAWLWGIPGALMAVPFLVWLKVICDNVPSLSVIGTFLSGEDTLDIRD